MRRRSPGRLTVGAKAGPRWGLGSRGGRWIDVDAAIAFIEANPAVGEGEEGVIASHSNVLSCLKFCAALADDDGAGGDGFSTKTFHAEPLATTIASVPC